MKWRRNIMLLLTGMVVLGGCGTIEVHTEKPEHSIGVVLKALDSPYWLDLQSGMEHAASDYGVDMILLYPEGEKEEEEQERLIADILDSGIDALLMAPCNSYHTQWIVDQAKKNQVEVIAVDTKAVDTSLTYIGSDNARFGTLVAEYFNEQFEDDASILLLLGPNNQSSVIERYQGICENLNSNIRIEGVLNMELQENYGFESIGQLEQPVDGIYCQNSILARGAVEALVEKGWDSKVVAVDTREEAVRILREGAMDALIVQNGYEIGYRAVEEVIGRLENGKNSEEDILFDGELFTLEDMGAWENVSDYDR